MSLDIQLHHTTCPSSNCRGQFLYIKHYGVLCTVKLLQEMERLNTRSTEWAATQLSRSALIQKSEGLGLA